MTFLNKAHSEHLSIYQTQYFFSLFRGDNVEDAFLDTAKKIYQNIQDGRYKSLRKRTYFSYIHPSQMN